MYNDKHFDSSSSYCFPDGMYNIVLIYQDYLTQRVVVYTLDTKRTKEVALQGLDFFSTLKHLVFCCLLMARIECACQVHTRNK
jgi:hypothetical protein